MEGRNKANFFSEVLLQTHLVIDILAKITEGLLVHCRDFLLSHW